MAQHQAVSESINSSTAPACGISVIVPVFNSESTLPELTDRLFKVLSEMADEFELILVNDCSRDNSWNVICELAARHSWINGIDLMRNYGQHNAILCGVRTARFDVIITMDDDLQHPPEEIPKLLEELKKGYDVVYGPPETEQHGFSRDIASQLTKFALQHAMGADIARKVSAFRCFRAIARNAFASYNSSFISLDALLTWATCRFSAIPVRHEPRRVGASNYNFRKLVIVAVNMITGFSTFPLQVASLTGFTFTLFGITVLTYVLGRYIIVGSSVPGFPFLASVIAIFSGAQLFALGIIGEYLARMFHKSMGRPTYVVAKTTLSVREQERII